MSAAKRKKRRKTSPEAPAQAPRTFLEAADGNGFHAVALYIDSLPLPRIVKRGLRVFFMATAVALLLCMLLWPAVLLLQGAGR